VNTDDIYNLSVRKKIGSLCSRIKAGTDALCRAYENEVPSGAKKYIAENQQIKNLILRISNEVKAPAAAAGAEISDDPKKIITGMLADISYLADIICIRHIERELIFVSRALLEQLNGLV